MTLALLGISHPLFYKVDTIPQVYDFMHSMFCFAFRLQLLLVRVNYREYVFVQSSTNK